MQDAVFERRPLYTIGTVARLSGVKPDTLRIWERRYGLGASLKSATGRRQYTQSDLDHLQLIAALVAGGSRIGEVAAAPRKTLEMLLRSQSSKAATAMPVPKPKVVCVGEELCDWLDEHQGCLANVDALLARCALGEAVPGDLEDVDMLVVECTTLVAAQKAKLDALVKALEPNRILVMYQYCNERWLQQFKELGITTVSFPPDAAFLAFELGRSVAEKATSLGDANLGDLIAAKPTQFTQLELSAARDLKSTIDCECPTHITDLIRALANFEEYSASCSVDNWRDASIHACIYAYTGQARWLMEKALGAVLEERTAEFSQALQQKKQGSLNDAA